jgi:membrane-associated protein
MPLLPGDSLLFAVGTLAARPETGLNMGIIVPLLIFAALLGDQVNYYIGRKLGGTLKKKERILFLKREYLEKTEAYYQKHGPLTIILARFIPIVRTVAPFVAGASNMVYRKYVGFGIAGAIIWVNSIAWLGYLFGNNEWVKGHFEIVVLAVVGISFVPVIYGIIKSNFFPFKDS